MSISDKITDNFAYQLPITFYRRVYNRLFLFLVLTMGVLSVGFGAGLYSYGQLIMLTVGCGVFVLLFLVGIQLEHTLRDVDVGGSFDEGHQEAVKEVTAINSQPNIYQGGEYEIVGEGQGYVIVENELGGKSKLDSSDFKATESLKQTG